MTEIVRVERADGTFDEREATPEELARFAVQRGEGAAPAEHEVTAEDTVSVRVENTAPRAPVKVEDTLPTESEQDLFTRAKEITAQEVLTTEAYHRAGDTALGHALLYAGYLAEHYRALVGNREPSDEELRRYRVLLDDFERLLRRSPDQPYP